MAKKSVKYNGKDNSAKIFGIISNKLVSLAPEYEISTSEMIKAYIEDLENENKKDYEKQVEQVSVLGLTPATKKKLIKYLEKMYKAERSKEERDKRVEITKKRQEENEEYKKQQIEGVWGKVCEGANKYIQNNDDEFLDRSDLYPKAWIMIRERMDGILKRILASNEIPDYLKTEITKRVEDEIYFQEVRYFTEDFKFLAGLPEAGRLSPYGRKFIRFDSKYYKTVYNRYANLRDSLPVNREELAIRSILEKNKVDNVTKRILSARLEYIDRKNYEEKYGNIKFALDKQSGEAR